MYMRTSTGSLFIKLSFYILLAILAGCGEHHSLFKPKSLPPEVSQLLRQTLEAKTVPASLRDQKELVQAWEETRSFYGKRAFLPVWSNVHGPRPQAEELIEAIPAL